MDEMKYLVEGEMPDGAPVRMSFVELSDVQAITFKMRTSSVTLLQPVSLDSVREKLNSAFAETRDRINAALYPNPGDREAAVRRLQFLSGQDPS